ncbi:MAG: hypothetical protein GY822_11295 [Deltaproteobacteria bacterium]|nr:hypothetical protein [Deltaproteobacteria bacterium]
MRGFSCAHVVDAGPSSMGDAKEASDEMDPCQLDDATFRSTFFKGPSIPPEQIHIVHPYLDDVELAYEGGRLRAVTFVANDWIQRKELMLLSLPEVKAPLRRKENLCRGSHWCVTIEAFSKFDRAECSTSGTGLPTSNEKEASPSPMVPGEK